MEDVLHGVGEARRVADKLVKVDGLVLTPIKSCTSQDHDQIIDLGLRFHLFPRDPGKDAVQGPPKLSEDCRLRSSRSPRTVLVARGRTLNPVCREQRVIMTL